MSRLTLFSVLVAGLLATTMPAPVGAVTHDKLAYLTFSGKVQIPGAVLNAGTYRFRLADAKTRKVIQVLSKDGLTAFAMVHTLPAFRTSLTDNPAVTFRETPAGVPPAVGSLFYGGEHEGYELFYPNGIPITAPGAVSQPEVTYTPMPAPAAPAAMAEPAAKPVKAAPAEPVAMAAAPEPARAEPARPEPEPAVQEPAARELPKTASPLPFWGVGGLLSLFAGLGAGVVRRHVN